MEIGKPIPVKVALGTIVKTINDRLCRTKNILKVDLRVLYNIIFRKPKPGSVEIHRVTNVCDYLWNRDFAPILRDQAASRQPHRCETLLRLSPSAIVGSSWVT
jgi:hypothetical protein